MHSIARLLFLIAALFSAAQPAFATGSMGHGIHGQGAHDMTMEAAASPCDTDAMAGCPATVASYGDHGNHGGSGHGPCPQQACGACISVLTILPLPLMELLPPGIAFQAARPAHFPRSPHLAGPYKPPRRNA